LYKNTQVNSAFHHSGVSKSTTGVGKRYIGPIGQNTTSARRRSSLLTAATTDTAATVVAQRRALGGGRRIHGVGLTYSIVWWAYWYAARVSEGELE